MDITTPLFMSEKTGAVLRYSEVRRVFLRFAAESRIIPRGGHRYLRVHDLRHTFICRRLMLWQENGTDVDNAMMALSTYVGHVNLGDTYWYLQAVPELIAVAGARFETQAIMTREVHHG
jgi:integrase/recombinase XerD